tara:strand:- start:307 stop:441 length:135 start_codon:yes stop_codon:yes gene_type:complete
MKMLAIVIVREGKDYPYVTDHEAVSLIVSLLAALVTGWWVYYAQ